MPSLRINLHILNEFWACQEQCIKFRIIFGDVDVLLTPETLRMAHEKGLDIFWLKKFLSSWGIDEYNTALSKAAQTYDTVRMDKGQNTPELDRAWEEFKRVRVEEFIRIFLEDACSSSVFIPLTS